MYPPAFPKTAKARNNPDFTQENQIAATPASSILLSGDIVIIDPCYIFPKDFWSEFCEKYWEVEGSATIEFKNTKMLVAGTAFGDGVYTVFYNGNSVGTSGVDAGLLCAITLNDAKKLGKVSDIKKLGTIIKDYQGGEIHVTKEGNWESSSLSCGTDGSDYEEEEDNWEE